MSPLVPRRQSSVLGTVLSLSWVGKWGEARLFAATTPGESLAHSPKGERGFGRCHLRGTHLPRRAPQRLGSASSYCPTQFASCTSVFGMTMISTKKRRCWRCASTMVPGGPETTVRADMTGEREALIPEERATDEDCLIAPRLWSSPGCIQIVLGVSENQR